MSNYTKTTNFGAKDTLPSGDSQKIIRGTEFDTEFNNVATAIATKLEVDGSNNLAISGTFSSTKLIPTGGTATGNGMYLPAANAVAISTNGTERLRIDSSGVASFASNPILNGGTANGLVYLDGSKVATSGSAVTFDGTNLATTGTASATKLIPTGGTATGNGMYLPAANTLALSTNGVERVRVDSSGNLGVGTTVGAASGTGLIIYSPTSTRLQLRNSTTGDTAGDGCGLLAFGSDLYVENRENGATLFFNNGSESARITSGGNFGVGTASPGAKLDIGGTNNTVFFKNSGATTGYALAAVSNTGGAFQYGISSSTGTFWGSGNAGNYSANIGTTTATNLGFGTNDTLRMLLDSSGNLGVGVTPSAWNSATKNIQNPAGSLFSINTTDSGVSQNLFLDSTGTWKYVNTAAASYFAQSSGSFVWTSVGSGTAGATASLTTKMTLDSSGNLGLGVTPSAWNSGGNFQLASGKNISAGNGIGLYANGYFDGAWKYINSVGAAGYVQSANEHIWYTAPSGTAGNTITFYSALTLSGSDTSSLLTMGRGFLTQGTGYAGAGSSTADPYLFYTNNTERARITSGGQLCLGVTVANGSARFTVGGLTTGTSAADVFVGRTGTETDGVGLGASIQLQNNTNTTACIIQQYSNNLQFFNYTGAAWTERARIKSTGQFRFVPLSSDPSGAESGDVYYNSTSNKLKVYNGTSWVDLH